MFQSRAKDMDSLLRKVACYGYVIKQGLRYVSLSENQLDELQYEFRKTYASNLASEEDLGLSTEQIEVPNEPFSCAPSTG